MKRISASNTLVALAVFAVLVHIVSAGDLPREIVGSNELILVPGAKCLITAQLECEISQVDEDSIHVTVSAIRKTMQGTPILSELPYANRLFKNTGVENTEIEVVIRIPKHQVTTITPADTSK